MPEMPIWLVEHEVGQLPTERVYGHSAIGHIILPEGMTCQRYADYVALFDGHERVTSLSTRRLVEAAIEGEFGLSWRLNPAYSQEVSATADTRGREGCT